MNEKLQEVLAAPVTGQGDLIPLLQKAQDAEGYITEEAIYAIADKLGISSSEVFGVLSFYAQFRLTPIGRKLITVCRGTACHVRGGAQVIQAFERELNIQAGETTPDMEYTLETVACVGACALAPLVVVNDHPHGLMTPTKVEKMLADYTGGQNADDTE